MAIENMDSFKSVLNHYRRQGYETALDDVGAGESGLNTLLALNPTYLKLDMEIIRDIEKHHNKRSLVKAFVQFANTSNTILIAEGIETEKELAVLIELGVDYGQGFYLGRPEPQLSPLRADIRKTLSGLLRTPQKTVYQPLTLKKIMKSDEINQYIDSGNLFLERLGYTEHSRVHSAKVSCTAGKILAELNYSEEDIELARIAGYMHDIGNCVNRTDHAHTGGILAFQILTRMNIDPAKIAKIVGAIGNHDERTGCATAGTASAIRKKPILISTIGSTMRQSRLNFKSVRTRKKFSLILSWIMKSAVLWIILKSFSSGCLCAAERRRCWAVPSS